MNKLKIKAIYDNGGKTLDRYTVYYNNSWYNKYNNKTWDCLGMNSDPFHGIGTHGSGMLGRHNGKRIAFEDLPEECQKAVKQDLE